MKKYSPCTHCTAHQCENCIVTKLREDNKQLKKELSDYENMSDEEMGEYIAGM